jgi:hypothetical protein
MTRAGQCRAKAVECERLAQSAHDPKVRRQLRKLAADWRELAMQIEENEERKDKLKGPAT